MSAFTIAVERAYRAKQITRLHAHVAYKLAGWRTTAPTHRLLARAAGCSERTVRRALKLLLDLGLLTWTRRVLACRGWRAQIANSYVLNASSAVSYMAIRSSAGLAASVMQRAVGRVGDLLAARRLVIEQRLRARAGAAAAC